MVLGCDLGTAFTKGVLLEEGRVLHWTKTPTEANPARALERVLGELAERGGVLAGELPPPALTGWGEGKVALPHRAVSLMSCLARAAVWAEPSCRSVLCLGAQQGVALSVAPNGRVLEYRENDKCASGAGRFLEIILEALECTVETSAEVARGADRKLAMSSQCAVFAESEVVSLVNDGESVANIVEAILESLSKSAVSLCKKIKVKDVFVAGGGLLRNQRIVELLREGLGRDLLVFQTPGPDFLGAVGAALLAGGPA